MNRHACHEGGGERVSRALQRSACRSVFTIPKFLRAYFLRNREPLGDLSHVVFADPLAGVCPDPDHSHDEQREIIVGQSNAVRFLLVSFAERDGVIRIISARELSRRERAFYEKGKP